jgi:glycosyltransferase involved in cell wall biosynthesis
MSRLSYRFTTHRRFIDTNSAHLSRAYGRILAQRVARSEADWLFAPFASAELAYLETDKPVFYFSDTTFRAISGYYPDFTGLSARSIREGNALEQRAIDRATVACFASDWAARSAIDDYGAPHEKVHVVPLPANLVAPPARDSLRFDRSQGPVRLLFIGVDWVRKGGPIAVDTLRALRGLGIDAELTVVGCTPPSELRDPALTVVGYLSKRDPAGARRLDQLFRDADFLVLPTRAECYGIVFGEAAAYALPSIATDTGGVRTAMAHGGAGLLLPYDVGGGEYASRIAEVIEDGDAYRALRVSARAAFDDELNWETWGRRVNALTADW